MLCQGDGHYHLRKQMIKDIRLSNIITMNNKIELIMSLEFGVGGSSASQRGTSHYFSPSFFFNGRTCKVERVRACVCVPVEDDATRRPCDPSPPPSFPLHPFSPTPRSLFVGCGRRHAYPIAAPLIRPKLSVYPQLPDPPVFSLRRTRPFFLYSLGL